MPQLQDQISSRTTVTTTSWNTSSVLTKTFTFASRNQLRYFFNAGGLIRLSVGQEQVVQEVHRTLHGQTHLLQLEQLLFQVIWNIKNYCRCCIHRNNKNWWIRYKPRTLLNRIHWSTMTYSLLHQQYSYSIRFHLQDMAITKLKYYMESIPAGGTVLTLKTDLSDDYTPPDPGSPDLVNGTLTQTINSTFSKYNSFNRYMGICYTEVHHSWVQS